MKNKKNKKAFSIIMAMGLVLIMSLLVLYILEYIIPYSKNVKGIENSSNAFYQTENSIEDTMLFFKNRSNITEEDSKDFINIPVDYKYSTTSSGNTIPPIGEGNSEYDKDFNIISQGNPIQLKVGKGVKIDWNNSNTKIYFKIPDISGGSETLSGGSLPIINWQLSSDTGTGNTLNATGSWIKANQITGSNINISNFQGIDLNGNENNDMKFGQYYKNNCYGTNSGCTLKFSIINKLELTDGTPIPYLEYKFYLESSKKIPLRYSRIKSSGKSYGFQKRLEVKVPQQTTNEAFDFTVFQ